MKSTLRYKNPALRVAAMNIVTLKRTGEDTAVGTVAHSLRECKMGQPLRENDMSLLLKKTRPSSMI